MVIAYVQGDAKVKALVDGTLAQLGAPIEALFSALGRHAARALEAKLVADALADWVLQLKPGEPVYADYELPDEAEGMGLADGPRGALGHWIAIKDGRIANYQCVVPTTWNASPRDDRDQPGPVEQALQGVKVRDEENPFELVRIVRSFDPCLACAVHLVTPKGRSLGKFRVL
jgi:hydrogenase large subunit